MTRFCSFDGCGKALTSHSARSLCSGHYQQWQRGEALVPLQPRNTLVPWLLAHIEYNGDDCLKWPGKPRADGRGQVKWRGRMTNAHRQMCILAHGEPPFEAAEATHSCGNGHLGCVNPKHLRWATDKQNKADMLVHGTRVRGEKHGAAKLTAEVVMEIREMRGIRSYSQLAGQYGITGGTVGKIIRGERWGHV